MLLLISDFLGIHEAIRALFLIIDGSLYNLICGFYKVFLALAKLNLFSNEDYASIVRRVYIVLGIVMLFVLSYSLLRAIVNPDEYAKGEKSFPNLIKNVLISLVIIVLLPTIFDVAFRVQAAVLNHDVIGRIILNEKVGSGSIENGGSTIAANVFKAFFYVNPENENSEVSLAVDGAFEEATATGNFEIFASREFDTYIDGAYVSTVNFPKSVVNNEINHSWPWSMVAGVFVLWCILLFCFDLGVRAIKLIYYQMIGPIAVACRVIPGNKTKDIFPNWLKLTVATFMEVFIRILIMYIGVYLITLLVEKFPDINAAGIGMNLNWLQIFLLRAFLIMGIVAFIRQAPKLIQDVFGFDTGGMNLGVKGLFERLGNGGALAAVGGAGALVGGAGQRWRAARSHGRGIFGSLRSAIGGGLSAGGRAMFRNFNSKSMSDFRSNTNAGINDMLKSGQKKDEYIAKYHSVWGGRAQAAKEFLGLGESVESYDQIINKTRDISSANDALRNEAEKVFEKHKTDPTILAAMSQSDFKGPARLWSLYQQYAGQSAATIEQDIERKRKEVQSRDSEYYHNLAREDAIKQIMAAHPKFSRRTAANIADTQQSYINSINNAAQQLAFNDSNDVALLDSMYAQMKKYQITNLAEVALDDNNSTGIGGIKKDELYRTRTLGHEALEVIHNSGLTIEDPDPSVTDPDKKVPKLTAGHIAKYIDDSATVGGKMGSKASYERQRVIQKQQGK